jgi:hypothetical protein
MSLVLAAGIWMLDNEIMFYPAGVVRMDGRPDACLQTTGMAEQHDTFPSCWYETDAFTQKVTNRTRLWHRNTTNHVISEEISFKRDLAYI